MKIFRARVGDKEVEHEAIPWKSAVACVPYTARARYVDHMVRQVRSRLHIDVEIWGDVDGLSGEEPQRRWSRVWRH